MTRQFAAVIVVAFLAGVCAAESVETVDLQKVSGSVKTVTSQQVTMTVDGSDRKMQLSEISEITYVKADDVMSVRNKDQQELQEQNVLITASGDRLLATDLTISDGKIRFTNPLTGQRALEMSAVSVIYHPLESLAVVDVEQHCTELKCQPGQLDMIVVMKKVEKEKESEWLPLDGVIKGLAPEKDKDADKTVKKILFNIEEADKKVAYESIAAMYLATTPKQVNSLGVLKGRCGSTILFTSLALAGDTFTIDSPSLGKLQIPRESVASIKMSGSNLTMLSDIKPSNVQEQGFFDTTFHYILNNAVSGDKLRLGGQEYQSGLGLHSSCELTYDLDGKYSMFVAVVGIDDAVRPNGDAELTIRGDDKELLKPVRLTGKDNPSTIRLELKGVKKLTIKIGFGQDGLDIGDHVDLASARLIK